MVDVKVLTKLKVGSFNTEIRSTIGFQLAAHYLFIMLLSIPGRFRIRRINQATDFKVHPKNILFVIYFSRSQIKCYEAENLPEKTESHLVYHIRYNPLERASNWPNLFLGFAQKTERKRLKKRFRYIRDIFLWFSLPTVLNLNFFWVMCVSFGRQGASNLRNTTADDEIVINFYSILCHSS